MTAERTSVLGGESKNRGLISGRRSKGVTAAWAVTGVTGCLLLLFLQFIGLVVTVLMVIGVFVATFDPGTGATPWSRFQDRRRMRYRRRHGLVDFIPVDQRPDDVVPGSVEWNKYRDWPDGADGLYWLQHEPGVPAVAYHAPVGEEPWLTVAFSVDGPIQGLHGDAFLEHAQYQFGQLLAGWGSIQKLVSGIQIVTRVLPGDSAAHELWLQEQLDPDAPEELQADYAELLDERTAKSFVQRHFVVVRWNVNAQWHQVVDRRGDGLAGWLAVVMEHYASVKARLEEAMYRNVRPMSGPRMGAVLRHMQHPGWPIDRASDVNVVPSYGLPGCWLPSHDEWSWTEVVSVSPDPFIPELLLEASSWRHRTARIPTSAMEVRELDGLWLSPLLTGLDEAIVRTLAVHIQFIPGREAKVTARKDATQDQADLIGQEKKGRIVDDETELALSAANRRANDLRDGSGHHGANWVAYLQVSTPDEDGLAHVSGVIEEAADQAGIGRLDWLDTLQSAAHATTWPLGRGITPPTRSRAMKTLHAVSSGTPKEAL